jgi:UDP-glucose 4-epimerase
MKVLVTGATGLIGRHLVERISEAHEVTALARGPISGLRPDVLLVRQDLSQPLQRKALPERIDAVIHLAQSERYREFPEGAADVFAVNVQSTLALLEYSRAAGASRFVLASTGGVYAPSDGELTEESVVDPKGPYAHSKRMAEFLVEDYAEILTGIILRPFFVYGPGPSKLLIARLLADVRGGRAIEVAGSNGPQLNPIYVSEAAAAFEAALGVAGGGVFNVAGPEPTTIAEIAGLIAKEMGREAQIVHTDRRRGPPLIADTHRMQEVLGVTPQISMRDGIARLVGETATEADRVR